MLNHVNSLTTFIPQYPTLHRATPSVKDRPKDLRPLLTIIKPRTGVSARYDFVEVIS
ncbi:MAG: hypothetical protein IJM05_04240 [Bacteroidales bacterium]|nr:hypothetical protein [Bacteroidales bacterium]